MAKTRAQLDKKAKVSDSDSDKPKQDTHKEEEEEDVMYMTSQNIGTVATLYKYS
jgi:hypothetical protein